MSNIIKIRRNARQMSPEASLAYAKLHERNGDKLWGAMAAIMEDDLDRAEALLEAYEAELPKPPCEVVALFGPQPRKP